MVLDPFCGCATALVAADRLQRQWAGIDLSPLAIKLVDERITEDRGDMPWGGAFALEEPPKRTDLGDLPNYRTHRHRLYGEQEGVCIGCDTSSEPTTTPVLFLPPIHSCLRRSLILASRL